MNNWFEVEEEENIPEHGSEWGNLSEKVEGNFANLYTIPNFYDTAGIIAFIQDFEKHNGNPEVIKKQNEIPHEEYKKQAFDDLILSWKMAKNYLQNQPRTTRKSIYQPEVESIDQFLKLYQKIYNNSQSNIGTRIHFCILLKKTLTFFKIIRSGFFKVDAKKQKIDIRNKNFINKIIEVFSDEHIFSYKKDRDEKFWKNSDHMIGGANLDGQKFSLEAYFGIKSVERLVQKMSHDPKYTKTVEAVQDLHRMRIVVENEQHAMRIARLLHNKMWWNMNVSVKGNMISLDEFEKYEKSFLQTEQNQDFSEKLLRTILSGETSEKSISSAREELRLSRPYKDKNNPSIEIQIVLKWNHNEIGWFAHHSIYEMKGQIQEIITDKGYISHQHIQDIIDFYSQKDIQNNGYSTIGKTKEEILFHILWNQNIREIMDVTEGAKIPSRQNKIYSNKQTLENYIKNYPNTVSTGNIALITRNMTRSVMNILQKDTDI